MAIISPVPSIKSPDYKSTSIIDTMQVNNLLATEMRPLTFNRFGHEFTINIPAHLFHSAEQVIQATPVNLNLNLPLDANQPNVNISQLDVLMGIIDSVDKSCRMAATTGISASNSVTSSGDTTPVRVSANENTINLSKSLALLPVLRLLMVEAHNRFFSSNNVHVAAANLCTPEFASNTLRVYYSTMNTLFTYLPSGDHRESFLALAGPPHPALFNASLTAKLPREPTAFAVFGGQGSGISYLDELNYIYVTYHSIINHFLSIADAHFQALLAHSSPSVVSLFTDGLYSTQWLNNSMATPSSQYLISAPVSFPMIGLVQLAWYLVLVKVSGATFAEARDRWFKATTGHSQGLITSVVLGSVNSDEQFIDCAKSALTLLFHIGTQATLVFPTTSIAPHITKDAEENGEGTPSPMLAISGALSLKMLEEHVCETNRHLPSDKTVHIALVNGPKNLVVAGPPQSLYGLCLRLRKFRTPVGKDESRVPHGKRGITFAARFLPTSAPFHSPYLAPAINSIRDIITSNRDSVLDVKLSVSDIKIPTYTSENGVDIRNMSMDGDLAIFLAKSICTDPVNWERATEHKSKCTHYIDFGPHAAGAWSLIQRNKEGSGVQVIVVPDLHDKSDIKGLSTLLNGKHDAVSFGPWWEEEYRPRLTYVGDTVHLDTKFTRLVGKPSVMVAGMTPTTVSGDFVAAVLNAGYHIELAGGGHFTEGMLRDKVEYIMTRVEPGNAITLNMMFLNPRQWAFQYPLVQALRKEGYPVEGVCIAAGVPSMEVASEILTTLSRCGIKHVAFKPGSADALIHVVRIAERHPSMPIILQWTGGRSGGHHSFEDMHAPVLEHYAAIRRCKNLVLVGGSGFGGVSDTLPYMTGDWSLKFNRPRMPFDGVLFGSRMLVAKEARTSNAVKDLIVACPGVENEADWENSYDKPTGGILTVRSELGEPIHKVATRGVQLWKELDDTIFSLPKDKRMATIRSKKAYIIDRLNRDAHRVWFGKKSDGSIATDLSDMTYAEVMNRLVELTYLPMLNRLIDPSYASLLMDVLQLVEERFTPVSARVMHGAAVKVVSTIDPEQLGIDPRSEVKKLIGRFPLCESQLLASEDVMFLLTAFSLPIRKPVPFIPILDESFDMWYKKDSLWQSEFVEAVVGEDPQRVCILQGPVATRFADRANVPAKDILDTVRTGHIAAVLTRYYDNDLSLVPRREYLTMFAPMAKSSSKDIIISVSGSKRVMQLPLKNADLPQVESWIATISAFSPAWLRALILSPHIVQGRMLVDNFMPRLLSPRAGMVTTISPSQLIIQLNVPRGMGLTISLVSKSEITLTFTHVYDDQKADLTLSFVYSPETPYALVRENLDGHNNKMKHFYASLWGTEVVEKEMNSFSSEHVVSRDAIMRFCNVIGNDAEEFVEKGQERLAAPLDYAIVAGWKSVVQPLFSGLVDGDLLKLVHLSNSFNVLVPGSLIYAGDKISTHAEVVSMTNTPTGKKISVKAILSRTGASVSKEELVEVKSCFFVRGIFDDHHRTFDNIDEEPIQLTIQNEQDLAILKSKEYIQFDTDTPFPVSVGSTLLFRMKTHINYESTFRFASIHTVGTIEHVQMEQVHAVGRVNFICSHPIASQSSPALAMLQRLGGVTIEQPCMFENSGYTIHTAKINAPTSNSAYASVSGDFNPIHTNPLIAEYAGLPATITHGMWTSAMVRRVVELHAAENQPSRVVSFSVDFVDMCAPSTELVTTLRHVGMQNGRKIVEVLTVSDIDQRVILKGTAHVAQASICYIFTGQGSQEVGMGQDLYNTSSVARDIWNRADSHLKGEFGFSILDIVRNNPPELTVHFGGKKGRRIRDNYLAMTYDVANVDGSVQTKPLFPSITTDSEFFTYRAPQGLLYATQFTQPALTLVEKAAFSDMEAHGLIAPDCPFAGHSLGEYAALASVADVLSVEALVEIVFYRGLVMQSSVDRDITGMSNFGMVAVNPTRVHKFFKETDLEEMVKEVRSFTADGPNSVLEIVNRNVTSMQYVIAGDLQNLNALTLVLNAVAKGTFDRTKLQELVQNADLNAMELVRGHATIPLPGIDVPFHSSFLRPGVGPFRKYLSSKLLPKYIHSQRLEGRYIPNLTAKPFRVTREYIQDVADQTASPVLLNLLNQLRLDTSEARHSAARVLLIELLSYQFASAVRWIETQDVLFSEFKVERVIEVGPSSTLTGMAERTLKVAYTAYDDALTFRRLVLSYVRNYQEIYYQFTDTNISDTNVTDQNSTPTTTDVSASASVAAANTPSLNNVASPSGAEPIPDEALSTTLLLSSMIGQKLKKPISEVTMSKSVKELVGGKSTMQNEILGDLQKEIGSIPERAEETPLDELASQINVPGLGKHTSSVVAKLISSKMPGGFTMSQVKEHLLSAFGLGPLRSDALLLIGTTMEPANRLPGEKEAKEWLHTVAQVYAQNAGIQYRASAVNAGSGGSVPSLSAAQVKALFSPQQQLWVSQLNALATALNLDMNASASLAQNQVQSLEALQQQLDLWVSEHGDTYAQGIIPMFDPRKARHFDSSWNWVRQHVLSLFYDIIFGRLREVDRAIIAQALHVMNRADPEVIVFMEHWLDNHLPFFVDVSADNRTLVSRLGRELVENCKEVLNADPVFKYVEVPTGPNTVMTSDGKIEYTEVHRHGIRKMASYVDKMLTENHLHINEVMDCNLVKSKSKTEVLFDVMSDIAERGLTLANKTMLITGCGRDSIGAAILKGALSAGAKVIVTTSSFSPLVMQHYRSIFEQHGSRGSALVVVPFNAGSYTDVQRLVEYTYNNLKWDIDFIVPFAAISENGRELTDIDSRSELAHRLMLTNLLRLLGAVVHEKRTRDITTRPAHVLLPLSPNHGTFGGDGLYGESKIALETLLNRWESESWNEYLCIIGAEIGWTRGTGLMSSNNLVANGVEELGVYTFSTIEMAFNLLALLHPKILNMSQEKALHVDLAGRMNRLPNLKENVNALRAKLIGNSEVCQAILRDQMLDQNAMIPAKKPMMITPRANLTFDFPVLPKYQELNTQLGHLEGMVDLDRVVVITGYGEVGPYGNARTRWEMEASGSFSLEGALEMAWIMGLIKFYQGMRDGRPFAGWVDAETNVPVNDTEVKARYEERILKHTGIRFIEPALFDGYNPEKKTMLQEIVLDADLCPFEASKEEASRFLLQHGPDKCIIKELPSGQWSVTLKKSATLFIPKALRFDRLVAGQIPAGWSARRYGVPEDICDQVDPITLYVLVSTVEALVASGITDPYEFYKYVHVTEVGNTSGSGVGGMVSNRRIFRERFLDRPVQNDILQESFINTMAAWVNLLLLSSSGPIKTPVGACATAVESVEIGFETILSGKAKIVIAGGFDDFQEEGSYEFANMKATSNADEELSQGRTPKEMCRPSTTTRGGFMESQGSGIQVMMSASVAIEMGVPIYGVIALSNTATDKQGRSVPAPGQGILTTARQVATEYSPRCMDMAYRKRQMQRSFQQIAEWLSDEVQEVIAEAQTMPQSVRESFLTERQTALERDAARQRKNVLNMWGNNFWASDPTIAPLRGALAVWGLNIDDIGVASFHGTGTKANDLNESEVVHRQLEHLGRTRGNPVPAIFQKYLTGHPKGAAAAWMLNGVLQVLETGIIPGNRNADNIDHKLQSYWNVLYPSVSMQTDGVKAAVLKSFGFGQVGGELLVLHPNYVLATLSKSEYTEYSVKRTARQAKSYRYWHDTITGKRDFVDVKDAPPYRPNQEMQVYLNPLARADWDPSSHTYSYNHLNSSTKSGATHMEIKHPKGEDSEWLKATLMAGARKNMDADVLTDQPNINKGICGVGVDVELVSVFAERDSEHMLITRNFTCTEIEYCMARPDPSASLAGRWAAKEAVVKALSSVNVDVKLTKGAGAPLKEIEIISAADSGVPVVKLSGDAEKARKQLGVSNIKVTISHSGEYAAAVCNVF